MQNQQKDSLVFIIAVLAAQIIGSLVTQMSPLVLGAVITGLDLSEQQAGYVVFAEFLVLSITAIVAAPYLPLFSYRKLCIYAVAVTIIAHGASVFLESLYAVVAARCIAGLGQGLIYAVSLAAVASRSSNPDKLYGIFQITWALLNMVLFTVGGHLSELYAHKGIFGLIGVVSILLAIFLSKLPDDVADRSVTEQSNTNVASPLMGILTLAGIFVYLTVSAAVYTFTAPLGARAGLSTIQIGYALTAASIIGLSGAVVATWLNIKKGRTLPITIFCVSFASIAIVICLNTNPIIYVIALMLSVVFFYFSVPYLFGLAAALDKQGRWAAAAGSAYLLGFAVGPAFAGTMIEWFEYPGLGVASALGAAIAWLLLMIVVRYLSTEVSELESGQAT